LRSSPDRKGLSPIVGAVLVIGILTGLAVTLYSSYSRASSRGEEGETLDSMLQSFLRVKEGLERVENGGSFLVQFKPNVGGRTAGTLSTKVSPAWWDYNWTRRMAITVQGSHPADYQLKLVVPKKPEMREDYGDLRFFEEEWGIPLPYWIENRTSDNVTVWVRRLKPNDGTDNLIYVYYGNPRAMDASNGEATFLLFEDFSGASLDTTKWTWHNPVGAFGYSISNGEFRIYTITKGSYANGYRAGITCPNTFPENILVEKRYRFTSAYREGTQFSRNDDNMVDLGGRLGSGVLYLSGKENGAMWYATGPGSQSGVVLSTLSPNTYYIHQLQVRSGLYIKFSYLDSGRKVLMASGESQVTYLGWDNLKRFVGVSVWHDGSTDPTNNDFYVDWILVRRWAPSEPTVSFGSPQAPSWGEWSGWVEFTFRNLEIGDLKLRLEEGGLIRLTGEGAEMLSPPVLLKVGEVREGGEVRWLRVEVRHFVLENGEFQLASSSPVSLRFTCTSDLYTVYPENGRPNAEEVVLDLENRVSTQTSEAWREYLEYLTSLFPPYYSVSVDPSLLRLTVQGFNSAPGVKDILYYERCTKIRVEVA